MVRPTGSGPAAGAGTGRGRQLMKAAIRGYVNVADRLKVATAETREQISDLVAEVRDERRMVAEAAAHEANDADEQPDTAQGPTAG